jgi:hypothetical protein
VGRFGRAQLPAAFTPPRGRDHEKKKIDFYVMSKYKVKKFFICMWKFQIKESQDKRGQIGGGANHIFYLLGC